MGNSFLCAVSVHLIFGMPVALGIGRSTTGTLEKSHYILFFLNLGVRSTRLLKDTQGYRDTFLYTILNRNDILILADCD